MQPQQIEKHRTGGLMGGEREWRGCGADATLLHATAGTAVIFDDYFDRPHYHVVKRFARPAATYQRTAEFVVARISEPNEVWRELLASVGDPR